MQQTPSGSDPFFYVLVFDSTSHSIQTEKKALENRLHIQVIPTPVEISASCGLAIRFLDETWERVERFFKALTVPCRLYRQSVQKVNRRRETQLLCERKED